MTVHFNSLLAGELRGFLQFKRSLGYRYARAEFTLGEFDRFLLKYAGQHRDWRLDQAMLAWLASKARRKTISVSADTTVLRQLCAYLRRRPRGSRFREPLWPKLPTGSTFVPYFLSKRDIHRLLELSSQLKRPRFRAALYRALLLLLYCTGIRFGEALRLRLRDVDGRSGILFVEEFKGRARWVPFHRSLALELDSYLKARRAFASVQPEERFFVGVNKRTLPVSTASHTIQELFRKAGLKPDRGRIGPRPYDLRHAFAVHRLSQWYQQGVNLHSRLPWLSAYMGHVDILGTETYLKATPQLLGLVGNRFRGRYLKLQERGSSEL
jgi:integrase/recombinase XerD